MVLDKEEHRTILLQMINGSQVPGGVVQEVAEIKTAIKNAAIGTNTPGVPTSNNNG